MKLELRGVICSVGGKREGWRENYSIEIKVPIDDKPSLNEIAGFCRKSY